MAISKDLPKLTIFVRFNVEFIKTDVHFLHTCDRNKKKDSIRSDL